MSDGFKLGDAVLRSPKEPDPFLIIQVECEHDSSLGTACDMGRYTLRASDGAIYHNMPGYLFRRPAKATGSAA